MVCPAGVEGGERNADDANAANNADRSKAIRPSSSHLKINFLSWGLIAAFSPPKNSGSSRNSGDWDRQRVENGFSGKRPIWPIAPRQSRRCPPRHWFDFWGRCEVRSDRGGRSRCDHHPNGCLGQSRWWWQFLERSADSAFFPLHPFPLGFGLLGRVEAG